MPETFYFYDLETSGLNPRADRIMQFAGMRTDQNFQPIGEPDNLLIKLADDTLPSPSAIMVTGISPNATRMDGISEREFCQFFNTEVARPGTTIMGYNSVRFDDEFIRAAFWRNFYDPYAWQWQDRRSRWDLLDVVRLTRALRPEGIKWPFTPDGKPTNRLELITKINHIEHQHAHDALSDVEALISVTKLIKAKQPQLFDYLFNLRNKKTVARLVNLENPAPFVYASGRYSSEHQHTTVAYPIAPAENGNVLVYDLRYNLDELLAKEAAAKANGTADPEKPYRDREPWEKSYHPIVKKLQYNHCPAVAPLGVLDKSDGWQKIGLTPETIQQNLQSLTDHPEFIERMQNIPRPDYGKSEDVESQIYDGFLGDHDNLLCSTIRANDEHELKDFHPHFQDPRLPELFLHYKAKNFPSILSEEESEKWEAYRRDRLSRQSVKFLADVQKIQQQLSQDISPSARSVDACAFLLEELTLWYESLAES